MGSESLKGITELSNLSVKPDQKLSGFTVAKSVDVMNKQPLYSFFTTDTHNYIHTKISEIN